jgi:hypothetical protein
LKCGCATSAFVKDTYDFVESPGRFLFSNDETIADQSLAQISLGLGIMECGVGEIVGTARN